MRIARPTLLVHAVLATAGVVLGVITYADRPSTPVVNHPDNNLIGVHVGIAVAAAVVVLVATLLGRRSGRPSVFAAPFGVRALARVRATFTTKRVRRPLGLVRAVVSVALLLVMGWEPLRSAMQPIAALDPHFRANAWGGPGYAGATAAHWLDSAVLFYLSAGLLHLVLVPVRAAAAGGPLGPDRTATQDPGLSCTR